MVWDFDQVDDRSARSIARFIIRSIKRLPADKIIAFGGDNVSINIAAVKYMKRELKLPDSVLLRAPCHSHWLHRLVVDVIERKMFGTPIPDGVDALDMLITLLGTDEPAVLVISPGLIAFDQGEGGGSGVHTGRVEGSEVVEVGGRHRRMMKVNLATRTGDYDGDDDDDEDDDDGKTSPSGRQEGGLDGACMDVRTANILKKCIKLVKSSRKGSPALRLAKMYTSDMYKRDMSHLPRANVTRWTGIRTMLAAIIRERPGLDGMRDGIRNFKDMRRGLNRDELKAAEKTFIEEGEWDIIFDMYAIFDKLAELTVDLQAESVGVRELVEEGSKELKTAKAGTFVPRITQVLPRMLELMDFLINPATGVWHKMKGYQSDEIIECEKAKNELTPEGQNLLVVFSRSMHQRLFTQNDYTTDMWGTYVLASILGVGTLEGGTSEIGGISDVSTLIRLFQTQAVQRAFRSIITRLFPSSQNWVVDTISRQTSTSTPASSTSAAAQSVPMTKEELRRRKEMGGRYESSSGSTHINNPLFPPYSPTPTDTTAFVSAYNEMRYFLRQERYNDFLRSSLLAMREEHHEQKHSSPPILVCFQDNPLSYFEHHLTFYPHLSRIARAVFTIQPTTGMVERLFSAAGQIYTPRRSQLSKEVARGLLQVKFNMTPRRKRHILSLPLKPRSKPEAEVEGVDMSDDSSV